MSVNPINHQVSIPRAAEVSQIQNQAIQKSVIDQTELGHQSIKDTEHVRTQTQKTTETEKGIIRDDHQSQEKREQQKKKKDTQSSDDQDRKSIHPYKGHSIDIKL